MPATPTHEIVIRGRIGDRLLGPFSDDFIAEHDVIGRTRLVGVVRDASHLHGLVAYLASINAELISITPVASADPFAATTPTTTNTQPRSTP